MSDLECALVDPLMSKSNHTQYGAQNHMWASKIANDAEVMVMQ